MKKIIKVKKIMLETLKKAIFGDPKEKQKRELEQIIKAKLEPVEAYLVINGTLWEHDYKRPYKRTLKDGFRAFVFKIETRWVLEIRDQFGDFVDNNIVHNGEEIEKIIQKYI